MSFETVLVPVNIGNVDLMTIDSKIVPAHFISRNGQTGGDSKGK
jgi:hypothetical protein